MTRPLFVLVAFVLSCASGVAAAAQATSQASSQPTAPPTIMPVYGQLLSPDGSARTGVVKLVISIYEEQASTTALWSEEQQIALDAAGRYTVAVGATQADGIPYSLLQDGTARWVGVAVQGDSEHLRVMLTAEAYAARARTADSLTGGLTSADLVTSEKLTESVKTVLKEVGVTSGGNGVNGGTDPGVDLTTNFLIRSTNGSGGTADSVVYDDGTNVGIGTTSPSGTKLKVVGTGSLFQVSGSSDKGIYFGNAASYLDVVGLNSSANTYNSLGFRTGNAEGQLFLRNDGTVGIGTVNPAGTKLKVVGSGALFQVSGTNDKGLYFGDAASWVDVVGINSGVASYNSINFRTSGNNGQLFLRTDGNVGIGTTGPSGLLDITKSAGAVTTNIYTSGGAGLATLRMATNGLTTPDVDARMVVDNAGTIISTGGFAFGTNTAHPVTIHTGGISSTANERARIDASGNFGIGTTNPAGVRLKVVGTSSLFHVVGTNDKGLYVGDAAGWVDVVGLNSAGSTYNNISLRASGTEGQLYLKSDGNVGIGTTSPTDKLHVVGNVTVSGNIGAKYQDVAEWVETSSYLEPGTVVIVDPVNPDQVVAASVRYDTRVAGAVSKQPGLILGEASDSKAMVAQSGRVRIKVDATFGAVKIGDLLVTSPTPGHAMLSKPIKVGGQLIHRPGTLLGKALEPLPNGRGEILVLLTLQ